MDNPEPTRRHWFDLRAAVMLGFLALVACFVAWKWRQSASRDQLLEDLARKGVVSSRPLAQEKWSYDWPFHDVERVKEIHLIAGTFDDDDVRRLRRTFPGIPLYRVTYAFTSDGTGLPPSWQLIEPPEGER